MVKHEFTRIQQTPDDIIVVPAQHVLINGVFQQRQTSGHLGLCRSPAKRSNVESLNNGFVRLVLLHQSGDQLRISLQCCVDCPTVDQVQRLREVSFSLIFARTDVWAREKQSNKAKKH